MVGFFIALLFIYNLQVLSGSGEKSPLASSQTRDENSETVSPDSDSEMVKCGAASKNCSDLDFQCMRCKDYTSNCTYGDYYTITCNVPDHISCLGEHTFQKIARCQYCYQTENWEHKCTLKHQCTAVASPPQYYKTNCTVYGNIICLGQRIFPKKLRCNWTRGHKWSTALILSITLGGFGADRFYLGHWQEGIGKLFSFGGLGVWTLVDVLLIAIRYLGPADGSFYV